jgi:hypothetical protein
LPNSVKVFFIIQRGVAIMRKEKISFSELVRKNKEEILKDQKKIEKIEMKVEEKYTKAK